MAQKTIVQLMDDLDGTELTRGSGETVEFGLDGQSYEIDLSRQNANKLREALSRYLKAGRKAGNKRRIGTTPVDVDSRAVRAWARANGIELSPRGRVPADVVRRFREAGN